MISFAPIAFASDASPPSNTSSLAALDGQFDASLASLSAGANGDDLSQAAAFDGFGIFGRETEPRPQDASTRFTQAEEPDVQTTVAKTSHPTFASAPDHNASSQTRRGALDAPGVSEAAGSGREEAPEPNAALFDGVLARTAEESDGPVAPRTSAPRELPVTDQHALSVVVFAETELLQVAVGCDIGSKEMHSRLREALEAEIQRAGFRTYRLTLNGVESSSAATEKP